MEIAIGASLAMSLYLKKRGLDVHCYHSGSISGVSCLPGCQVRRTSWYMRSIRRHVKKLSVNRNSFICVDFNNLSRLNWASAKVISSSGSVKILIDHHLYPSGGIPLTKFRSAGFPPLPNWFIDFISESGYHNLLDKEIAECLYTGLVTDTGSFSYACNYGQDLP